MKILRKRTFLYVLWAQVFILLIAVDFFSSSAATGGFQPTPIPGEIHTNPFEGERVREFEALVVSPVSAGAMDRFGYVLSDTGYGWEDISSTGTAVSFKSIDAAFSEEIPIGWGFKFYENLYSSLYISIDGFISFNRENSSSATSPQIPFETVPNGYIGVFMDNLILSGNGGSDQIYYAVQGKAPNRKFIAQWEGITKSGLSDPLSFQVILFENGDIKMQYRQLSGVLNEATVAIEDADGLEGLVFLQNSTGLVSEKAILFKRPSPQARVKILSEYLGGFVIQNSIQFPIWIRNTGEIGADQYNLSISQNAQLKSSRWRFAFYHADGRTPLKDTEGNGFPDTDSVRQGEMIKVVVELSPPAGSRVGDHQEVDLQISSSRNPNQVRTARLQAAVPAPFAQTVVDPQFGVGLDFIWRHRRFMSRVSDWYSGSSLAVGALEEGYISVIERNVSKDYRTHTDLEYSLASEKGAVSLNRVKLTDNLENNQWDVADLSPTTASLPNGRIGVVWTRSMINYDQGGVGNSNILMTVLDRAGNILDDSKEINLTNNEAWSRPGQGEAYSAVSIAPTAENQFLIVWTRTHTVAEGSTSDIVLGLYDQDGSEVTPARVLLAGVPRLIYYGDPVFIPLSGNQFLLAYSRAEDEGGESTYRLGTMVLDSNGAVLQPAVLIPDAFGWRADGIQVTTGEITLAWTSTNSDGGIGYTILKGNPLAPAGGVGTLNSPDDRVSASVSVTRDEEGNAILTWLDQRWRSKLYYALIDGQGNVLTPPISFYPGLEAATSVMTSEIGLGNAPFRGYAVVSLPFLIRSK